jgi:putative ABC transport system ATP-binding protein
MKNIKDMNHSEFVAFVKMLFSKLVMEDKSFLKVAIVYGIAISMLTLSVPISVQMLINTIANVGMQNAVVWLTITLFVLLMISCALVAMQTLVLERFERRIYARITADFTLYNLYAERNYYKNVNRYELVNRYFDIVQVQKILPRMVVELFATLLQMLVGMVLVSLFHPWLLLFTFVFVIALYVLWRAFAYRAMRTAMSLSAAKYTTGRHLEDVANANDYYKTGNHGRFAVRKSEALIRGYIDTRRKHFKVVFSQHIGFLMLYALSNASLLGIGGSLVIKEQLTLGQLVAAELVLSAVFYGVSRIGYYLTQLYDLTAALEEIYHVYSIPQESPKGGLMLPKDPVDILCNDAHFNKGVHPIALNFHIAGGSKILVNSVDYDAQVQLFDALKCYDTPSEGRILIAGEAITDYDTHHIRDRIIILDRPTIIECSILDYLKMDAPHATSVEIDAALELVEMDKIVTHLPEGFNTMLMAHGAPLTAAQTLRLKLASAILARPHVLILNECFDMISYARRIRIMERLCNKPDVTLLYCSNLRGMNFFDEYLILQRHSQDYVPYDSFIQYEAGQGKTT